MESMFSWLTEKITALFEWLWERLETLADWGFDQVQGIFWWIAGAVGDLVLIVVESIPVPSWLSPSSLQNALSAIPEGVWWGLSGLHFGVGISMVLTAYAVRFFIRRLPVVG